MGPFIPWTELVISPADEATRHAEPMLIRDATPEDWLTIWPFLQRIVAAGETYSHDRALGEHALGWARANGYRAMQFNAVVETNSRAVGPVALTGLRGAGDGAGGLPPPRCMATSACTSCTVAAEPLGAQASSSRKVTRRVTS